MQYPFSSSPPKPKLVLGFFFGGERRMVGNPSPKPKLIGGILAKVNVFYQVLAGIEFNTSQKKQNLNAWAAPRVCVCVMCVLCGVCVCVTCVLRVCFCLPIGPSFGLVRFRFSQQLLPWWLAEKALLELLVAILLPWPCHPCLEPLALVGSRHTFGDRALVLVLFACDVCAAAKPGNPQPRPLGVSTLPSIAFVTMNKQPFGKAAGTISVNAFSSTQYRVDAPLIVRQFLFWRRVGRHPTPAPPFDNNTAFSDSPVFILSSCPDFTSRIFRVWAVVSENSESLHRLWKYAVERPFQTSCSPDCSRVTFSIIVHVDPTYRHHLRVRVPCSRPRKPAARRKEQSVANKNKVLYTVGLCVPCLRNRLIPANRWCDRDVQHAGCFEAEIVRSLFSKSVS